MSPGGAVAVAWLVYGYTGAGGCAMAGDGGHSVAIVKLAWSGGHYQWPSPWPVSR